jgi:hypothetical protein
MRLLTFIVADGVIPKLSILAEPESVRKYKKLLIENQWFNVYLRNSPHSFTILPRRSCEPVSTYTV